MLFLSFRVHFNEESHRENRIFCSLQPPRCSIAQIQRQYFGVSLTVRRKSHISTNIRSSRMYHGVLLCEGRAAISNNLPRRPQRPLNTPPRVKPSCVKGDSIARRHVPFYADKTACTPASAEPSPSFYVKGDNATRRYVPFYANEAPSSGFPLSLWPPLRLSLCPPLRKKRQNGPPICPLLRRGGLHRGGLHREGGFTQRGGLRSGGARTGMQSANTTHQRHLTAQFVTEKRAHL